MSEAYPSTYHLPAPDAVLETLGILTTLLQAPLLLEELIARLTTSVCQMLACEHCMFVVRDQDQQGFLMYHASSLDGTISLAHQNYKGSLIPDAADLLTALAPPACQLFTKLITSQNVEIDLGWIGCTYALPHITDKQRPFLKIIAAQVTLALHNRILLQVLEEKKQDRLETLFSSLLSNEQDFKVLQRSADRVGFTLAHPHALALIELRSDRSASLSERILTEKQETLLIATRLQTILPAGSFVLLHDPLIICIIDTTDMAENILKARLNQLVDTMRSRGTYISIGFCLVDDQASYQQAYTEAEKALQAARHRFQQGGVMTISDLGIFRYLSPNYFSFDEQLVSSDPHLQKVLQIAEYDRQKGTELLLTIDTFLRSGGESNTTARAMNIARNTVLQRLERISTLIGINVMTQTEKRAYLQLALDLYWLNSVHPPQE